MSLYQILARGLVLHSRSFMLASIVAAVLVMVACSSSDGAAPSGESGQSGREAEPMPQELTEPNAPFFGIERTDCVVEEAVCRSECKAKKGEQDCAADPCSSRHTLCLATLPLGKFPELPVACKSADQDAFQRLERQGELLDADPTLFAESYNSLIRARIACRAGNQSKALDFYDEIIESMRVKQVPAEAASTLRR